MKATVTSPPVSVTRVIVRSGSRLSPSGLPPHILCTLLILCSSSYSGSPGAMQGALLLTSLSLPSPSMVQRLPPQPSTPAPCKSRLRVGVTGRCSPNLLGAEERHQAWSSLCEPPGCPSSKGSLEAEQTMSRLCASHVPPGC